MNSLTSNGLMVDSLSELSIDGKNGPLEPINLLSLRKQAKQINRKIGGG